MMWAIKDPEKIKESVIRPRRGSLKGNEVRGKPKFFFYSIYVVCINVCSWLVLNVNAVTGFIARNPITSQKS